MEGLLRASIGKNYPTSEMKSEYYFASNQAYIIIYFKILDISILLGAVTRFFHNEKRKVRERQPENQARGQKYNEQRKRRSRRQRVSLFNNAFLGQVL